MHNEECHFSYTSLHLLKEENVCLEPCEWQNANYQVIQLQIAFNE
jgi:hypothetical protein